MDGGSATRVVRSEFATTDADTAEHALRHAYGDHRFAVGGRQENFAFDHSTISAPRFAMDHLRIGMDVIIQAENAADGPFVVSQPVAGRLAYVDSRYPDAHADADSGTLIPPVGPMRSISTGLEMVVVPLKGPDVAAYAAAVTGLDPDELAFDDIRPLGPAEGRNWVRTVSHVRHVVHADPRAAAHPILLEQAFRTLAAALLSTFPNSALARATHPHTPSVRGDVSPATVRKVVEYLDAHADEPIGPTDIADHTGPPANEVTAGLRRYHDRHPAQVLWEARMRGTQRDLREADPQSGTTVAEVATRWGFARDNPFRVACAKTFDETPEDTLSH
jgi:AraC-like DNA-binding protein